jgi:hypothetical protein
MDHEGRQRHEDEWHYDNVMVRRSVEARNGKKTNKGAMAPYFVEERDAPTPMEELATALGDVQYAPSPTPSVLIARAVQKAIHAKTVQHVISSRDTWDGRLFDIRADFVVLWFRDGPNGDITQRTWGTHCGCIREMRGIKPTSYIFTGYYDRTEKAARKDFVDRQMRFR